jgi:hypothetical protein
MLCMTSTQIVARVPADLAEAFALASERHERTFSGELRIAMRERLASLAPQEDERPDGGPGVVETDSEAAEAAGASK